MIRPLFQFQHRLLFPRPVLLATLVGAAFAVFARAEPGGGPVRCILLRNGNVLEGTPVQEGDTVTIRIGKHQSLRLPANQVLCWADNRHQLYRYRLEHRTGSDLPTHLEAARWCIREKLWEAASSELQAARAIDAADPSVSQLRIMLAAARQRAQEPPSTNERSEESELATDQAEVEHAPRSEATLARLSRSAIAEYASRVQPILINRCGQAGCHGGDGSSRTEWQLMLPVSRHHRRLPAEMTRGNLHNLARWINKNQSQLSPLLKMASQPHGNAQEAPLGLAEGDVLVELQRWVASIAAELPDAEPSAAPRMAHLSSEAPAFPSRPPESSGAPNGASFSEANRGQPTPSPHPKRLPPVTNPFDPQVFNRLHHGR